MRARTFTFKYRKSAPEWTGDVFSTVEVDTDGSVRVTTHLHNNEGTDTTQFSEPTGSIAETWTQSMKTRRYQYVYPTGRNYPGTSATVKEAARDAAIHAADLFVRRLFGKTLPHPKAGIVTPSFTSYEAEKVLELLDANRVGNPVYQTAAIALRDALDDLRANDDAPHRYRPTRKGVCDICGRGPNVPTHKRAEEGATA